MKITTRIALGLTVLAGLMVAALAYQVRTVNQLQGITEDLSRTNVEAARISILLAQELEGVREFASKSLVLADSGYVAQWQTWEDAVSRDLARLAALDLDAGEEAAVQAVQDDWDRYLSEIAPLRMASELWPTDDGLFLTLDRIDELVDGLRLGVENVIDENQAWVAQQAETSALVGQRATRVSWLAALAAIALGLLICVILYLSISGPLKRLTRGTREIAEGRFAHRLPTGGRTELSALAGDFNRMAARLDEVEEMKRDFVSHVSHELKGPLAAIQETILILLERIPGPLTDKQAQLLALSRQSANRLSGMISNLLEISRIEGGGMRLDMGWVDPEELVQDVVDEMGPLSRAKSLTVEVAVEKGDPVQGNGSQGPAFPISADRDRLQEVVGNLLGNAIKFSPRGSTIRIRVRGLTDWPRPLPGRVLSRLRGEEPPFLLLEVEDEGPGIPEGHREGVFQKFYQIQRGVRRDGQGVGLGLAISRNVIQAHGGAIWVREGSSGGAHFLALIPRLARRARGATPGTDTLPEVVQVAGETEMAGAEVMS